MLTLDNIKQLDLPLTPGSYQFLDAGGKIIYVGKAVNLRSRVLSYWQRPGELSPLKQQMLVNIHQVKWLDTDSEIEALLLEANLIKKHQPEYNISLRDDKRFIYIKVSLEDELPSVFATRNLDKSGKYYGPFVSTRAVRETLRAIRKIWPYCTTRKIGSKPCFYYQVGRCLGACGGVVSPEEYLKQVIKPLMAFLDGKKNKVVADMEREIKKLAKSGDDLGATRLKMRLVSLRAVLAGAQVLSVADKYANDVVELAKVLSLKKVPHRIEGYDLSTGPGRESVGVMVVFSGGEADNSQYRKFKIQDGGLGDTDMLKEVLERRLKHDDWPLPDLLIIDGGKAQLNTTLRILKKYNLDLDVLAISKGEGLRSSKAPDKIFFPGQSTALQLPLNSPALHLVKRVRDESHRFAIGFHRDLRSKKMFK